MKKREDDSSDFSTTPVRKTTTVWLEIKPYFTSNTDERSNDMLDILQRIDAFSFFIVRLKDGITRIYVKTGRTNVGLFDSILKNATCVITEEKSFSAPYIGYMKMKRHYALPFATEARPSLVYRAIESLNRPCLVALTCKYRDESYSIASFVRKNTYRESLLGSNSGSIPRRRLSSQRELYAKHAKEKQGRRHFHCRIGIGAADKVTIETLLKMISDDGLSIAKYAKEKHYVDKARKPLLFNQRFCVLSDMELVNIIGLPVDTKPLKLNYGEIKPFSSGPSKSLEEDSVSTANASELGTEEQ